VRKNLKIALVFLQRNLLLILIGTVLGVIIFPFRQSLNDVFKTLFPSRVKIGLIGKYKISNLPEEIISLASFGLVKLSTNNTPQPAAAISWETKQEGREYIFHLDPLLHWQDGSPLLSKDINLEIEGATIDNTDPYILRIKVEKPFAPLPALTASPLLKRNLVGLGDYRIKKIYLNAGYVSFLSLEANRQGLNPKQIIFRFYPNQQDLLTAFKLGEIDCLRGLSSVEPLRNWTNLTITPQKKNNSRYVALFFNTSKEPFTDKRFRQALAYALQKPKKGTRAFTPISPLSWAYNPNVKTYPFNVAHAQKILKETLLEKAVIQITTTFDLADWGEKIKKDWEKNLGLKTELRILPFIPPGEDFDIILGYGLIPPDPDQYPFWHSDQPGNITNFSNPRIDSLLETGRAIINKDERKNIYRDFQRFLLEELPAVFLFHPTTYQICRSNTPDLN